MQKIFNTQYFFDSPSFLKINKKAAKKMIEVLKMQVSGEVTNPLSLHEPGRKAKAILDHAAETIANILSVKASEIIFVSNASEANLLAVNGFLNAISEDTGKHAIISSIEHNSMLLVNSILKNNGFKVSIAEPNEKGIITTQEIKKLLTPDTSFVSIIKVNNELGTIQPLYEVSQLISDYEKEKNIKIMLHTDASQALRSLNIKPSAHGIDFMTLCSSKVGGPQGVSALFVKNGSIFKSVLGDVKKISIRAGTPPVILIAGFAEAYRQTYKNIEKISREYRDKQLFLIKQMSEILPKGKVHIHTIKKDIDKIKEKDLEHMVPNLMNVYIDGINHEYLATILDNAGFAVSTRTACTSLEKGKSKTLLSLERASGEPAQGIRIGFDDNSNKRTILKLVKNIDKALDLAKL